jgi:TPR repeat protein
MFSRRILKSLLFLALWMVMSGGVPSFAQDRPSRCNQVQDLAVEAALGDATAQYNLAVEFFKGESVPMDLAKSAMLWRLAVQSGNIKAHNNLGYLTYYGKGTKQDYVEAIRLWRIAAARGFAESQIHLAAAYYDGKYLRRNLVEAYAWAAAGRSNATTIEIEALRQSIVEMADDSLKELLSMLSPAQRSTAQKRAALYRTRYRAETAQ